MTRAEEFKKKNRELQQIISEEIHKAESDATKANAFQLKAIFKELLMMEREYGRALSYPHIIIDSWDYCDPLGKQLMELASLYKKAANKE